MSRQNSARKIKSPTEGNSQRIEAGRISPAKVVESVATRLNLIG
jgi:hypothetical protein